MNITIESKDKLHFLSYEDIDTVTIGNGEITIKDTAKDKAFVFSADECTCVCSDFLSSVKNSKDVQQGKWLSNGIALKCNLCGKNIVVEQGDADMNYCTHCGARMAV